MNGEKILLAIGDISDQHIMEFADVKPYKRKMKSNHMWVKWVAMAASIFLVISTVLMVNEYQHKNIAPSYNLMIVSGKVYEIIPFEDNSILQNISYSDVLAEHGLSYPIDGNDLGDSLGTYMAENSESYVVYDYKPYTGKSVLIVESNSQLQYALFCNLDNNNTILIEDLLEIYGVNDINAVSEICIDSTIVSNATSVTAILDEIKKSPISVDFVDTDDTDVMKIKIKGEDSDVLIFDYYPERNVLSKSLTFYQVSPALAELLGE